jgi:hypothetical protein
VWGEEVGLEGGRNTGKSVNTCTKWGYLYSVFAQFHGTVLPDETVVYVMAKVNATPGRLPHLDALSLTTVPSNVDSDNYQDRLPDEPFPRIFLIRQVLSDVPLSGNKLWFKVLTSKYVYDRPSQCTVQ